jgi:hypothetical protein
MQTRGSWIARLGNAATGLVLVGAVALLAYDRALPALRERSVADPGEPVPEELLALDLERGDTVSLADTGPATLLAVLSTCPACERSAGAWREALAETPGRLLLLLVGESPDAEAAWAARLIPGAVALLPLDRPETLRRLRIRTVPTAVSISPDGELLSRREGGISSDEARRILAALDPRPADSAPRDPGVRGDGPDAPTSNPSRR